MSFFSCPQGVAAFLAVLRQKRQRVKFRDGRARRNGPRGQGKTVMPRQAAADISRRLEACRRPVAQGLLTGLRLLRQK
jgi:hypothetical protein